jgi:hypothetical protein
VNRSAHEVAITAASQLMFGQGPSAQPVSPVGAPVGSMYVRAPGSTGQIGIVGFRSDGDTGTSVYTMQRDRLSRVGRHRARHAVRASRRLERPIGIESNRCTRHF